MIDTHCHLNDDMFNNDVAQVVTNFLSAGVNTAICVSYDLESSIKASELADEFNCVYYAVGVHPDNLLDYNEAKLEALIKQAKNKTVNKLVAIGEIGLDYFHNKENKEQQRKVFISQIELANKYGLPIIIHCRDAYGDTLEILKQYAPFKYGAVMHCYGGSLEYANELLRLGVKMSFTGTATFKNAKNVQEVVKNIPVNSFFFETDCPYLTPEPNRGKRNEPKYVVDIARFVAMLRNVNYQELEQITDSTAKQFFNIK